MSSLMRTKVGPWSLADAISLEELRETVGDGRQGQILATKALVCLGFSNGLGHSALAGAVITQEPQDEYAMGHWPSGSGGGAEDSKKAALETMGKRGQMP